MNKFSFILFGLLILSIFWIFWIPGVRVGNDYHFSENETVVPGIQPLLWKETNIAEGLGEYTITTLWSQPLHTFFGILAWLGLSFETRTKILGALVLMTAFFSIRSLLKFTNVGFWGEIVGTLFYLTNTFFILMFDGGQLSLALAYGVLPAAVLFFLRIWKENNFLNKQSLLLRNKIWFVFFLLVLSFLDPRILYLAGIIFFIYFLLQVILFGTKGLMNEFLSVTIKTYFQIIILSALLLIGAHFYWILPSFLTNLPTLPVGYSRSSQVDFLSFSSIGHSIFLQQPHWHENIFGKVSVLKAEFILIPFLIFLSLFLKKKNFTILFWLVVALAGIFLSKGSKEPFSQVYPWFFNHIPGFSLFRDPVKFYFLIGLAYSVLIGVTVDQLQNLRLKNNILNKLLKFSPLLVIAYLVFLVRPVFFGQMTGLLSVPRYQFEFNQLANYLKADANFSRVFWVPSKAPLGYSSSLHPYLDAGRILNKRPFAAGTKGTYEVFNFLREAPYMGQIFDVAGVGYIVNPFLDPKTKVLSPDDIKYFYTFSDQLSRLPWLTKIPESKIPTFKVNQRQDKFFLTPNLWWVVGSDNIYKEATKSAKLKLSGNALIFPEESAGLGKRLDQLPDAKIVLNNKTILDLATSFIDPSKLIFPAKKLNFDPDKSGWWKREAIDLISWRDFLQTKYGIDNLDFDLGGGWAVGEGKLELRIKNLEFRKNKILLARVLESTRSGQLEFSQDGDMIGGINTNKEGNNIRWFEVGQLPKNGGEIEINSFGDINVVNALVVLDKNEWLNYQDKAKELQGRVVNFDDNNADISNNPPVVTYQQINPTKYVVKINNLNKPALLIFSQNYNNLWEVKGQTPLPVYSLLNGFKIDHDGEYIVEIPAQKYVYLGLIISGLSIITLVLVLIKLE